MTAAKKLPQSFYLRDDVVEVGRLLLGKVLCTRIDGAVTKSIITETEAYAGVEDRASHAYGGRRTRRTEPMYGAGGSAYVYLCYGIHHLFNVVTNQAGVPHAVLIRAGKALSGVAVIAARRARECEDPSLLAGPGSLSKGMGITTALTGASLRGRTVWLEDHDIVFPDERIAVGPRIGIDYAGPDAARPYRFRIA